MLKKKDLVEYFYNGIKSRENMRIGVEHEKFIINKKTLKPLSYEEPNGIKDILIRFTKNGWQPIYDDLDKTIIAGDLEQKEHNLSKAKYLLDWEPKMSHKDLI